MSLESPTKIFGDEMNLPLEIQQKIDDYLWQPLEVLWAHRNFRVRYRFDKATQRHLIRPVEEVTKGCARCPPERQQGYHCFEYEMLFEFGCHCEGFSASKVVDVTDYWVARIPSSPGVQTLKEPFDPSRLHFT